MKLYIGTAHLRPEGYTTVDIDPANAPDIVVDASNLGEIESGTVDEVYASHVLEHIAWPYALLAGAEWARVLRPGGVMKLAVPDMSLYGEMLARRENEWHAMACIYGGHWATPGGPQGHHFGYTWGMITDVMTLLGFGNLDHWNSPIPDAANGWLYLENGERVGMSLNVSGVKKSEPLLDIHALAERIRTKDVMQPVLMVARDIATENIPSIENPDSHLLEKLHLQLLEARIKIRDLEAEVQLMR